MVKTDGKRKRNKSEAAKKKADTGETGSLDRLMNIVADKRFIATVLLYISVCAVLLITHIGGVTYRADTIADYDIVSPRNIQYEDTSATSAMKKRITDNVSAAYKIDPAFKQDVEAVFKNILEADSLAPGDVTRKYYIGKLREFGLSEEMIILLYSLEKDQPVQLRLQTYTILKRLDTNVVIDDNELENIGTKIEELAREEGVSTGLVPAIREIILSAIKKNLVEDPEATLARKSKALEDVMPVMKTLRKGEIIVRKGDRILPHHIKALKTLGMLSRSTSWMKIVGFAFLIGFGFLVIGLCMRTITPDIYGDEKRFIIFCILMFFTAATSVVICSFATFQGAGYLQGAPIAIFTILVCVLLRPVLSLVAVPVLALVITLTLNLQLEHFLVALIAGLAAHFYSIKPQDKDSMLKAGAAVSLSNMAAIFILTLIKFTTWQQAVLDIFVFGALNGIVAFVVSTGSLPAFERLFNITTSHRLLELSNPEEPFLKQMLINAPGTYYHSFFVGNLAENVAETLGVNALLVRIACYYHDIGKIKRPYFFAENRMEGHSQLDEISPTLSALVISSHVKDGVEMALDYNLPDEIRDIIQQHHGTTKISYFHNKAVAAADGGDVPEESFRYPGPKPQTVEAAIVMLADSCEAAIRSINKPTPKLIETTVNSIVEDRLFDRQFDECNITLKQIDTLRLTLTKTLANVYHSRMEYPDLEDFKDQRKKEQAKTTAKVQAANGKR